MKRLLPAVLILPLAFGFAIPAAAQGASDDVTVSASVLAALQVQVDQDIEFGSVAQNTSPTIASNDAAAGIVQITGAQDETVLVDIDDEVTLSGPETAEMTFTSVIPRRHTTAVPSEGVVFGTNEGGSFNMDETTMYVFLGGTLTVGPSQAPGAYTGLLNVVINYDL